MLCVVVVLWCVFVAFCCRYALLLCVVRYVLLCVACRSVLLFGVVSRCSLFVAVCFLGGCLLIVFVAVCRCCC